MEILLAWIGKTDLNSSKEDSKNGPGPIFAAAIHTKYDLIILLNNYQVSEANNYVRWLRRHVRSGIQAHNFNLKSPTDFGSIYKAVIDTLDKTRAVHGNEAKLTFHLSPGTPAMAAIWIIVANTRVIAELIESSKEGGVSKVSLPFELSAEFLPDLIQAQDKELERLAVARPSEDTAFKDIIHRSAQMKEVIRLAHIMANHHYPVLIEGESGTGKEMFARAIHTESARKDKPFIAVNCGAIPTELVESELFGHVKGAFTGAATTRDGHFMKAQGGTIFLDEIGELPLTVQVRLLRVLQEKEVTPIGSSKAVELDVRVISATNRSLINEVAQGNFREDLFYRLAVFVLHLPPLREREGDIGLLMNKILDDLKTESPGLIPEHKKLSPNAKNLMLNYHWPGNVREMRNTIIRAAVLSSGTQVTEADIRQAIFAAPTQRKDRILNRNLGANFKLQNLIDEVVQHYLRRALDEANGNKSEAAKLVGLPSYQTLTNWLKKYKIDSGT